MTTGKIVTLFMHDLDRNFQTLPISQITMKYTTLDPREAAEAEMVRIIDMTSLTVKILKDRYADFKSDEWVAFTKQNTKEDKMKDRINIEGIWYVREDTLLVSSEKLRVEGVEPIYSDGLAKLKLVFYMPSAKFNVGDEIVIHNLTKLRKARNNN